MIPNRHNKYSLDGMLIFIKIRLKGKEIRIY